MAQVTNMVEAHSIDWIPPKDRHGRAWLQGPFWFVGNFQYFTIALGFVGPALGLSFGWSVLAGVLGIIFGSWFAAFHGAQGPKLGLPQMIQSRAQLGYRGVIIALVVVFFIYEGENVIGQVLLAQGLNGSFHWNADAVEAGAAALALVLAIFGHDWLHRMYRTLFVVSFPLMLIITIGVLAGDAGRAPSNVHLGFTGVAFMAQFATAAAYNVILAPYISDYSRYLKANTPSRSTIWWVFIGAAASPLWLIPLGSWMAIHLGVTDGLTGLKLAGNNFVGGVGSAAALASAAVLAVVAGVNSYGASLSVLTAYDAFRKIKPTRKVRIIAVAVPVVLYYVAGDFVTTSATNTINTLLTLMLYLIVPWSGINLTDFFLVRRGQYSILDLFRKDGIYGSWSWRGLTAYAVGFASEIPFMVLPQIGGFKFTGPVASALSGADISWIVGLIVSGLAYFVLCRSLNLPKEREAARVSTEELALAD